MRTLALVIAIALVAGYASVRLYAVHTAASVTLGILFAAGGVIAIAIVLRNAPRPPGRTRKGGLPDDPGFPKPPKGSPYRGP